MRLSIAVVAGTMPMACAHTALTVTSGSVEAWSPQNIASPMFESHSAFDPQNGDFYFVRSGADFRGWRILQSRCAANGWSKPQPPSFAGDGVEADPWFTPDGRALYFISTRSSDGIKRKDLDIWSVERDDAGRWGTPQRLPEPVNSEGQEWFPRLAKDGWLYFGSSRAGGFGKTDIWRARRRADRTWQVDNVGAAINSTGDEYESLPSPDGKRMIVMADEGLWQSRFEHGRWTPREKLAAPVNTDGSGIGAVFSPSGKTLLFARDTHAPKSGEFFVWHIEGHEAWPPECPRR